MRRTSSVRLPRVGAADGARVLRLRAGDELDEMLRSADGPRAHLEIASREAVAEGDPIRVEISFGPMSDEVELDGKVVHVRPRPGGRSPIVEIALDRTQERRLHYVRQVLAGRRRASARGHRRIPVDLDVRWKWGRAHYASKISDLSRGGAFIVSRCLPDVGSEVEVEILGYGQAPLLFDAVVSWVRGEGQRTGFGVNFRLPSRDAAAALMHVVKEHEQRAQASLRD